MVASATVREEETRMQSKHGRKLLHLMGRRFFTRMTKLISGVEPVRVGISPTERVSISKV